MFAEIIQTPFSSVTKTDLRSGLLKFPGGGTTTLDFMVNMFDGESGISLAELLMVSVVRGLDFKIASVSVTNVRTDSSSSGLPCFLRIYKK